MTRLTKGLRHETVATYLNGHHHTLVRALVHDPKRALPKDAGLVDGALRAGTVGLQGSGTVGL